LGPYSLYLRAPTAKTLIFFAGKIGHNPKTGNIDANNFGDEVRQALSNLSDVLRLAGVEKTNVLKASCFLTDMAHFDEMNKIYINFFGEHRPCRTTVAVKALPKNARFEIEVTCADK